MEVQMELEIVQQMNEAATRGALLEQFECVYILVDMIWWREVE